MNDLTLFLDTTTSRLMLALGNAQGMSEWVADSAAARLLAGRLRNDHA